MIFIGIKEPIPKSWKINAYDHYVQVQRISIWGTTMRLCSCGISLKNGTPQQMAHAHWLQEQQARSFLKDLERRYAWT